MPAGNPFAASHVSGLVARMLRKHPRLAPCGVTAVLRAVASNTERKGGGRDGG